MRYHPCTQYIVVPSTVYFEIFTNIFLTVWEMDDVRGASCVIQRSSDEKCCTYRNLPKVFFDLLSMIIIYYNDITLIYDVYYT